MLWREVMVVGPVPSVRGSTPHKARWVTGSVHVKHSAMWSHWANDDACWRGPSDIDEARLGRVPYGVG